LANPKASVRQRVSKLFEFLRRLEERRSPVRRDMEDAEWRLRFSDLPEHPVVRTGRSAPVRADETSAHDAEGLVLAVKRPPLTDGPRPPTTLGQWLVDGWRDPAAQPRFVERRPLANGQTEAFKADPRRVEESTKWVADRARWAEAELPARNAYALFDRIFTLWTRLQREGEAVRLLLGDGHLIWARADAGGPIRHPLILKDVEVRFDEAKRELLILATDRQPFLYAELLSVIDEVDGEKRRLCRELVDKSAEQGGCDPLAGAETDEVLKQLAAVLGASDAILPAAAEAAPATAGRIQRDPTIFLVPRPTGFRAAFEALIERLPGLPDLPVGLSLAVGGEASPTASSLLGADVPGLQDRVSTAAHELFFTKPANEAQERIAERLEETGAVLVQGPPGTGKTHTIANLIGHLLAKGESVLVTAQTSKALRVLREKVVDELKPLCVSVLESDLESRAELEHAVNGIVAKLTSDVRVFDDRAKAKAEERKELLRRIDQKRSELRIALASEIEDIVVSGTAVMPAQAARRVAAEGSKHDWLPGPVEFGGPLPLALDEVAALYRLSAELKEREEVEARNALPPVEALMSPEDFEKHVAILTAPPPAADEAPPWAVPSPGTDCGRLEALALRIRDALDQVRREPAWFGALVHEALLGDVHRKPFDEFVELLEKCATEIAALRHESVDFTVRFAEEIEPEEALETAEAIEAHLSQGKRLSWFARLGKKEWSALIAAARINGRRPKKLRDFAAIRGALRMEVARRTIQRRWDAVLAPIGLSLDGADRAAPEVAGHARLPEFRRALRWAEDAWRPCEREIGAVGIPLSRLWEETYAKPPQAELWRIAKCLEKKVLPVIAREVDRQWRDQLRHSLAKSKEALASFRGGIAVRAVVSGIEARDPTAYRAAVAEVARLQRLKERVLWRDACLKKLARTAPAWAEAVQSRRPPHAGPEVPGAAAEAWQHRQCVQELDRRAALDADALQREVSNLREQLERTTRGLVENLAWAAQARRTSKEQHRALMAWLDLVRRVGKGTGKRATEYQRDARKQLATARAAVPVWIMPLARVAESFAPGEKLFDVVILDEASQCDLGALVAFSMAKRVVVVGDDEQVSPLDIGTKVEDVMALQEEWLGDLPDKNLFDGRASAYEIARRSFPGGLIRLTEHFRCVPDIIAFSNSLSYKDEICPLRESSDAKVFPPVVAHRVQGARLDDSKINRTEAIEIASLVVAATEVEDYRGLELGAISLLGTEQALSIDTLLRRFLDPLTYSQRRIICGTAANFQGDERDVVFLSMVDSPKDGPLALSTRDETKKRFNVAASRARDQLWVVYSLDVEKDLKPDDLRRKLLAHALAPTEWRQRVMEERQVESDFEREVLRRLVRAGFRVRSQVEVGAYRLDLVAEGKTARVAVECDGDRYHSLEDLDHDLARQGILERLGWRFIRIRGSAFLRNPDGQIERVCKRLDEAGIERLGMVSTEEAPPDAGQSREKLLRRAAELRAEWAEEYGDDETLFTEIAPVKRGRFRARRSPDPEDEQTEPGASPLAAAVLTSPSHRSTEPAVPVAAEPEAPQVSLRFPRAAPAASVASAAFDDPEPTVSVVSESPRPPPLPGASAVDPLTAAISAVVTKEGFACPKCGKPRSLVFGRKAPFLRCGACGTMETASLEVLRRAVAAVGSKCDCGRLVRVIRVASADPFVGCSGFPDCHKTYAWVDLRDRARRGS
jgi:very-short-patch-repair endonuclease